MEMKERSMSTQSMLSDKDSRSECTDAAAMSDSDHEDRYVCAPNSSRRPAVWFVHRGDHPVKSDEAVDAAGAVAGTTTGAAVDVVEGAAAVTGAGAATATGVAATVAATGVAAAGVAAVAGAAALLRSLKYSCSIDTNSW